MKGAIVTRCRPALALGFGMVLLASPSCCKAWDGGKGDAGPAVFWPREDPAPAEAAGTDRQVLGNRKDLAGTDAAFVEFWDTLREQLSWSSYELKGDIYKYADPKDADHLTLDDVKLSRIDYKEILYPASTGALTVTFWRSAGGEYFLRIAGGCVTHRDILYGPFVYRGKFVYTGKAAP